MNQTIDLGKVAITPRGTWNRSTSYEALTEVVYENDGCGYVSLKPNVAVTPGTDPTVWMLAVQAGKSIYQLAVVHGYEGTEEEFVSEYNNAVAEAQTAATNANTKMAAFTLQEQTRQSNETARVNAEIARGSAENTRDRNESTRQSKEDERRQNENYREAAENLREQSFNATKQACETAAELAGEKAEEASDAANLANEKAKLANTKAELANAAANRAEALNNHPNYIDETSYHWMKWNEENKEYEDTGIMATGSPYAEFDIDTTTGQLTIETTNLYGGPTFELNEDTGNLEITI